VPLHVRVIRGDCREVLLLRCEGLPEGVRATTCRLGPNKDRVTLELTAWREATGKANTVRLVAEAGHAIVASVEFHLQVTVDPTEQASAIDRINELGGRWQVQRELPRGWSTPPVVEVDLSGRPATAENMGRILQALPALQGLALYQTRVSDQELVHLRHCPRLRSLLLGGTRITDEGLREVGKLARLAELSLVGCAISDAGLEELRGLTELRTLTLAYCRDVEGEGLVHLAALPCLEKLVLAETTVTQEAVEALQDQRAERGLGALEIVWTW
jgi:hypothetical protein